MRSCINRCSVAVIVSCFLCATLPVVAIDDDRSAPQARDSNDADESLDEYDQYVLSIILKFDTLRAYDWNESRYTASRVVRDIGSLKPKSTELRTILKKYHQEEVLPILLEKLDFRRTRRREHVRFPSSHRQSMYPVWGALADLGKPVIQPLLKAVAEKPRSATYVYQARIVLRRLAGSEKAAEEIVREYALAHPRNALRIERLSVKCDLGPEMRKEFEYQQLLKELEPKGMMIPSKSEQNLRNLKALRDLMPAEKK